MFHFFGRSEFEVRKNYIVLTFNYIANDERAFEKAGFNIKFSDLVILSMHFYLTPTLD